MDYFCIISLVLTRDKPPPADFTAVPPKLFKASSLTGRGSHNSVVVPPLGRSNSTPRPTTAPTDKVVPSFHSPAAAVGASSGAAATKTGFVPHHPRQLPPPAAAVNGGGGSSSWSSNSTAHSNRW